jgi:aspartyl aminopeptidase
MLPVRRGAVSPGNRVKDMAHPFDTDAEAAGLCTYVDASPSPFHACAQVAARLEASGFSRLQETERWPRTPGRYYVLRGGSLVAWSSEFAEGAATPFRVVGAHTDSPNLRVKPQPDVTRAGWQMLGVEVYGGPLLNSWLDRDLGLSGRAALRVADGGVEHRLVHVDEPVLRVPQLAIHLDREVSEGLRLNPQQHLSPLWGVGTTPGDFRAFVAKACDTDADAVLGWELMTHDLTPSRRIGRDRDLIAAPRLDNLATSYAGVRALVTAVERAPSRPWLPVLVLFDHEEVGSMSERGAFSTLLPAVLERVVRASGGNRDDFLRALAGSVIASGDMAHATHPNYADRHDPEHQVRVNAGPVLKTNAKLRYATDAVGAAAFVSACDQAGVPVQHFVSRSDLPCGSTVGPMTAALTGATTVDFGAPTLSMHSARELCGALDPAMYAGALSAFLSPA